MKNIILLALLVGAFGLTSCETQVVGPGSDINLEAEDQAILFDDPAELEAIEKVEHEPGDAMSEDLTAEPALGYHDQLGR